MIRLNGFLSVVASGRPGSNLSDPFDCDVYLVDTATAWCWWTRAWAREGPRAVGGRARVRV